MPPSPTPTSKTRKDRVEYIRSHIDNEKIRQYVALLDAATTHQELRIAKSRQSEFMNWNDIGPETGIRGCLLDAEWENDDRITKERKAADKARITAAKEQNLEAKTNESRVLERYLNYPMLKDAIKIVAESFRPDLIESFRNNKLTRINRFINGDTIEVPKPVIEGDKYSRQNQIKRQNYDINRQIIHPYHVKNVLKPNYREMVQAEAERCAEDVLEELRGKLAWKLGPVIDRKGGGTVTPQGDVIKHSIQITFPDASRFTIKSQIVHSVSKNGVFFCRHPMTFHNVTFEDGTRMKTPSATRMQKEFGIDLEDKDKTIKEPGMSM